MTDVKKQELRKRSTGHALRTEVPMRTEAEARIIISMTLAAIENELTNFDRLDVH